MALFGTKSLAATLLVAASALGAQAPAKPACDVTDAQSGNAARASLSIDLAKNAAAPAVAATNLKNAVKLLETPAKGDNPVVTAYVLGTALSLWANQPSIGLNPTRGTLGFSTSPDARIDLIGTIDSLFKVVEVAKPNCNDYTAFWRAGQKYYLDIVNGAINALNADKLDSAEFYATQANRLYSASPYGSMVLGSVAAKRNDNAKAIQYWTAAAEASQKDSSYRDVHRQMLQNIGSVYITQANTASGAEKIAAARKAGDVYAQLVAVPGTKGMYLVGGRSNMQAAYLIAGDTAAVVKSYEPLIANPSAYEYQDLLNSAVSAARANRAADAGKLFEATLSQNPSSRDALFNVAVTYLTLEQYDKVAPIVTRLVAVDPANPENYNLAARAYLAMAKAAQAAKKTALAAALNDTTVQWYGRGNKLPIEVNFTEFSPTDTKAVIGGTIMDRRDKAAGEDAGSTTTTTVKGAKAAPKPKAVAAKPSKSYPPKAITLNFFALDKTGAVVGTQSVTTEPLTPGNSTKFTVTVNAPNVVAYRYTVAE